VPTTWLLVAVLSSTVCAASQTELSTPGPPTSAAARLCDGERGADLFRVRNDVGGAVSLSLPARRHAGRSADALPLASRRRRLRASKSCRDHRLVVSKDGSTCEYCPAGAISVANFSVCVDPQVPRPLLCLFCCAAFRCRFSDNVLAPRRTAPL